MGTGYSTGQVTGNGRTDSQQLTRRLTGSNISFQDGVDGGRSMTVEVLEADLFEQSIQMRR